MLGEKKEEIIETLTMHIENWTWKGPLVLRNDRQFPRAGMEMASGDFWTVVLEKTLESPLDSKEIQPVHPKGNQSWIFIGRTDAEAETPILWPPDVKNGLIGKDPDAEKDWRWEEKGTTEGEIVGRHLRLDGHEFEQAPGVGDGQGTLACCSPPGRRVRHDWATELNWPPGGSLLLPWGEQGPVQAYSPGRLEPWLFLQGLLGLFPSHLGFSPGTEQNLTCQVCSSQDFTVKKFKFSTPTVLQARL